MTRQLKAALILVFITLCKIGLVVSSANKTILLLLDLQRESVCNNVGSHVKIEATEMARQRAEAAQWTLERLTNLKSHQAQAHTTTSKSTFPFPKSLLILHCLLLPLQS